jgi:hypothetical protein
MMTTASDPTLAGRYLADQLADHERSEYEALLVSSPDAVRDLEAIARLKVGLEKLRETGELSPLLRERRRSIPQFATALAAGIAALVIGAVVWRSHPDRSPAAAPLLGSQASLVDKAGHSLPIEVRIAVYRKRSGSPDAVVEIPQSASGVELRVLPISVDRAHTYRVSLSRLQKNGAFEAAGAVSDVRPATDGFLEVYAEAARLIPGRYKVVVADQAAGPDRTAVDTFWVDMVADNKH